MQQSSQESHYEIFYIQHDPKYKEIIVKVLQRIATIYATFKYLNYTQNLLKTINKFYDQIKLTKRKIIFAILISSDNPQLCPIGCKKINVIQDPLQSNDIEIHQSTSEGQLQVELIKKFQLDSVWVGLLYRIGTDIQNLQEYLQKQESFVKFQISLIKLFYEKIQQTLKNKPTQFTQQVLQHCKTQMQKQQIKFNSKIQQLIRSKFNTRIILSDITNHAYLNLLSSRNYFNLIYIQAQILQRFNHFNYTVLPKYPTLQSIFDFNHFVLLDDYIYSQFIFSCLGKAKKYINRSLEKQPYSTIVAKHHKDIIRQFRPNIHEYFLYICLVLKQRAACLKEAVGAIIVKNNKIISTGYNGTPVGTINCYNGGCLVCNNSEKMGTQVLSCRCIHAEYNCILKAGITVTPSSIMYSTKLPCLWCSKLIIQGRISQVICIQSKYSSLQYENVQLVKKTLKQGKVYVEQLQI